MERSSITLAHTHARNAVLETRRSNPVAASEEHDLAAAEFASAAQKTDSAEALRTLHLLEEHHKRLGQLLRFRHEHPEASKKSERTADGDETDPVAKAADAATAEASQHPPRLAGGRRATARELSSSIANNLASARGIPGSQRRAAPTSPTLSTQHAPGKFGKDRGKGKEAWSGRKPGKLLAGSGADDRSSDEKPSGTAAAHAADEEATVAPNRATAAVSTVNDAPFQQFYHTMENLMWKLSAPLAFAGLPLTNATTSSEDQKANAGRAPPASSAQSEPEYAHLISRAALRAVQAGRPAANSSSKNNAAAESFYVVPATGGTTSYADIMTRADYPPSNHGRHTRNRSNLSIDTAEDFVDAKETLTSPSGQGSRQPDQQPSGQARSPQPQQRRSTGSDSHREATARAIKINGKTPEELALENMTLRHDFDAVSRRLHVFEASAQQTSAALAHSIRFMARSSPSSTPENSQGRMGSGKNNDRNHDTSDVGGNGNNSNSGDAATKKRMAELEELLRRNDAELERRERDNVKLRETVGRYRKKWEVLKEGAKARREVGTTAAGAGTTAAGAGAGAGAAGAAGAAGTTAGGGGG